MPMFIYHYIFSNMFVNSGRKKTKKVYFQCEEQKPA